MGWKDSRFEEQNRQWSAEAGSPCSQSMGQGKLVMRWPLRSRQVLGQVPRSTDAVWKAKREMATSEMWLRKPLASRVEDGFKFSRSEDGGGGLLVEQPDSLLTQEINGPLTAAGDRKHPSCLRCRTDQIY